MIIRIARAMLTKALAILAVAMIVPGLSAQDRGITLSVFPSLAPNVFGSPSYPTWESNAIAALMNGSNIAGNPVLPSYYQQIPNGATIPMWLATEFDSWHLLANPGAAFGPDFAGENGNRLYFGLHINGNGQQFSISQLSFVGNSTDGGNFLGFSVAAGVFNYSSGFVGLSYGGDGVLGGGDDTLITSGPNTQLVNELFARGVGNAAGVSNAAPGATDQDKIDNALANLPSDFIFNGAYSLNGDGVDAFGSAFVVVGIPEPATLALTGVSGAALAGLCVSQWKKRRRRKKQSETKTPPVLA